MAKDASEGAKWFRKAAEQGFVQAQCGLGLCYESGDGVAQDAAEAVKWYRKPAVQGDARAQYSLAYCYVNGEGVEQVSDMPNLTQAGTKLGKLHWNHDLTGYTLVIDHGMGGKSNLEIKDVQLSAFRIEPKEGGTVTLSLLAESQDVPEKTFGKLATLKNREVKITLAPPVVAQKSIE